MDPANARARSGLSGIAGGHDGRSCGNAGPDRRRLYERVHSR